MASPSLVLNFREMTDADLSGVMSLVQEENWSFCSRVFMAMRAIYPAGVLVAVEPDGTLEGFISLVKMGNEAVSVNNIIVSPRCRGMGIGKQLMCEAESITNGKSMSLLSLEGSGNFYTKLGYTTCEDPVVLATFLKVDLSYIETCLLNNVDQHKILEHSSVSFEDINDFDEKTVGYSRSQYLKSILFRESMVVLVAVDQNTNKVVGYGAADKVGKSLSIAPLYADNDRIALSLFRNLVVSCANKVEYECVKVLHPKSNSFVRNFGEVTFQRVLEHMSLGKLRNISNRKIYGLISSAFH